MHRARRDLAARQAQAGRRGRPRDDLSALPLRHALALGAVQGPAELLPVSSSGHLVLLPALLRWPYADLPATTRKSFEVAVHAGSTAALAVLLRGELRWRDVAPLALTALPAAAAGLVLERTVERRLGGVGSVGAAQLVAGLALAAADLRPACRGRPDRRDHLAVALAQAIALVPGVSRAGASLTVLRLRRMRRGPAVRLSLRTALPVTVGAATLRGARAARGRPRRALALGTAAGAGAAFASTIASGALAERLARARSFRGLAIYRVALGAAGLTISRK